MGEGSITGQGRAEHPISHPRLQHHQDTAQITWFIPAFPHRQFEHAKEIPEAAATGSKPPAQSAGSNFPCVCKGKKKSRLNGLLILIQHRSEGFSSLTKMYHRCLAVCFNSPRGLKAGSDCVKCPREPSKGSQALCTARSSHSPSLVYPPATDTVPSC